MTDKPYIGVTGPATVQETIDVCQAFDDAGCTMESDHIPMIGFLVSFRTLYGCGITNKRYPQIDDIPELLKATDGNAFTMIHYNSRELRSLCTQVEHIFLRMYGLDICRSVQLNIPWPPVDQVAGIKEGLPGIKIVLQLSHKAIEGLNGEQIADRVFQYKDLVSYVLIDPSGGRGIEFDLESSAFIYAWLRNRTPELKIGFAGGFTGLNVESRVNNLIEKIHTDDFCIDAEGGLRDKVSDQYGDDNLNIEKVREYIQAASKVLR